MFRDSRQCEIFDATAMWLMALCSPSTATGELYDLDAIASRYGWPDLDALWALAGREKFGPLFAWRSLGGDWPTPLQEALARWPAAQRQQLQTTQKRQRKVAMAREVMLMRLDALIAECGTTGIVYKGCAYEGLLYPMPGLRPMTDIDLLVPKADFARFLQSLRARGYTVLQSSSNEQCLREPQTGILIDIHHNISMMQEGCLDMGELFARSKGLTEGCALQSLPLPEMFLLHLLHMRGHGMEPGFISLLQFAELAMLWSHISAAQQQDELLLLARQWQLMHLLALGLLCLEEMCLSVPVVPSLEAMTHSGPLARLQRQALLSLLAVIRKLTPIANQGDHMASPSLWEKRWRQGLRFSLRMLTQDDWRALFQSQKQYLQRALRYARHLSRTSGGDASSWR